MNRLETKKILLDIIDNIDEHDFGEYVIGHPAIYLFKSRDELEKEIDKVLESKDDYNDYDLLYVSNYLVKYMLGPNDSHTKIMPLNKRLMPIVLRYVGDEIYVINTIDEFKDVIYGKLISVNGVPIKQLEEEFEPSIAYSTKAYLKTNISNRLSSREFMRSLPSINDDCEYLEYEILKDGKVHKCRFDLNKNYEGVDCCANKNYVYKVVDDVLVLNYSSCVDEEKMIAFINEVSKVANENNINKVIVDLRNNGGGNSGVSEHILKFLEGKQIVTITNEEVFSSAVMFCARVKQLGSYFIGTELASTLSCFGDDTGLIYYRDHNLYIRRSYKYFLYDKDLNPKVYMKHNFKDLVKSREEFEKLDKGIIKPDEFAYKTIDDFKNGTDKPLERALEYIKTLERK